MTSRLTLAAIVCGTLGCISLADGLSRSFEGGPAFTSQAIAAPQKSSKASAILKSGLDALDRGRIGDALAARAKLPGGSIERKVLAWNIAQDGRGVDASTLASIANDLSHWPAQTRIRANIERALVAETANAALPAAFAKSAPETVTGAIALAKAHIRAGQNTKARAVIAPFWRDRVLTRGQERSINALSDVLTREDHKARVEMLMARERFTGAARVAGAAGMTRLVAARTAVERDAKDAKKRLAAVPKSQRSSATFILAQARYLRKKEHLSQAVALLKTVTREAIHPAARDDFWTESRIIASLLLKHNKPQTAYQAVSRNPAQSNRKLMDADFFAGWIALRKLNDAQKALPHFQALASRATTPISTARGQYWLGRTHAASGNNTAANAAYERAAHFDATYYGQLAARALGRTSIGISHPKPTAQERTRFNNYELVKAIEAHEAAGHPKRGRALYHHLARLLNSEGELALLSYRAEKRGDFQLALQVGKRAVWRGLEADTLAWPLGAISKGTRVDKTDLPLAYAIARQESTFQIDARSSANALGLMQLLPATAKKTAQNIGVRYSKAKLTRDGAYNARLGTAFLAEQMERFNGSQILTFAAYNAGPSRALDWIERNGDPRGASLEEAIDWVEGIPFSETRNYVMRVMENLQIYRSRLNGSPLTIDQDLRAGKR